MRIFLDLDGVLADFFSGVELLYGIKLTPWPKAGAYWLADVMPNMTNEKFWHDTAGPTDGIEFWSELKVYPWANDLVKFAEDLAGPENVAFLTKPVLDPYCAAGKTMWVQKHFPSYSRRLLIGSCKEMCASVDSVLIDDDDRNIEAFDKYGGHGILFPQPWNSAMKFDIEAVYQQLGSMEIYIHSLTSHHEGS